MNKSLLFVIIITLLVFPNALAEPVEGTPMELMGTDPEYDLQDPIDLLAVWVGSDETYLYMIIQYQELYDGFGYTNITIQPHSSSQPYLIMAGWNERSFLLVTYATSLEEDSKDVPEYMVDLSSENTAWASNNGSEVGFTLPWEVLGGQDVIDFVAWSSRPTDPYDRIPAEGNITYAQVENIDRSYFVSPWLDDYESTSVDPDGENIENGYNDEIFGQLKVPLSNFGVFLALSALSVIYRRYRRY